MLPANLHHSDLLWSPLGGDGAGWIPMMPSESLRGSEVHAGVAKVHRRLLSPTISCTAAASWKATWRQREGNVEATWRQREGNVNQMETSYRIQPTRPYQNKFKNFQALSTMLVFGVCLVPANCSNVCFAKATLTIWYGSKLVCEFTRQICLCSASKSI